ncbi:hypothetical protein [Amycolatopsis circi]|uniref:hypothetical protein n=1 Tax=Amycolatopsis circi TaxID=871959 RepID=UPI000E222F34|nr:hypothetical protein [Amycolatopsis circi]
MSAEATQVLTVEGVLAEPDVLGAMLRCWRDGVVTAPLPVVREPVSVEYMPTQPTFRVVAPRFPRAAAVVRWVSTVGAAGVAMGCFATAGALGVAAGAGVWS